MATIATPSGDSTLLIMKKINVALNPYKVGQLNQRDRAELAILSSVLARTREGLDTFDKSSKQAAKQLFSDMNDVVGKMQKKASAEELVQAVDSLKDGLDKQGLNSIELQQKTTQLQQEFLRLMKRIGLELDRDDMREAATSLSKDSSKLVVDAIAHKKNLQLLLDDIVIKHAATVTLPKRQDAEHMHLDVRKTLDQHGNAMSATVPVVMRR